MLKRMPEDFLKILFEGFEEDQEPPFHPFNPDQKHDRSCRQRCSARYTRTPQALVCRTTPQRLRRHSEFAYLPESHRLHHPQRPTGVRMLCLSSQPNCQGYIIERTGPEGKTDAVTWI